MRRLIEGIVEFRENRLPELTERFQTLAEGQSPDTLFISCSDSRVVPTLLLSSEPGDLFMLRNVGNIIPPGNIEGESTGDLSEASAIEYAVKMLQVDNIIVCGHSGCGAMSSLLSDRPTPQMPNLEKWLLNAAPALERLKEDAHNDSSIPPADRLSQLNVLLQIEHLLTYPAVRERVDAGTLFICGWWFDIANGEMSAYESDSGTFEKIDRNEGDRLIGRLKSSKPTN